MAQAGSAVVCEVEAAWMVLPEPSGGVEIGGPTWTELEPETACAWLTRREPEVRAGCAAEAVLTLKDPE